MKNYEDKMVYFVTGLPHSGTSIVQKTISNQRGYTAELKKNGNIVENANFVEQLKGTANPAVVTKLPCEPMYFQDIFYKIKQYLHNPNLCIIFTKRNPVQWCSSYLSRYMHPNARTEDINLEFHKEMDDFNYDYSERNSKNYREGKYIGNEESKKILIDSKESLLIYLKKFYDGYLKEVNNIINSERNAKVTCIDLLDFSNDPDKFLKTIGFEHPIIEGKDSDGKDIEKIQDEWRHEEKRVAQIANKPNPNIIKKNYDFHPTIIDFIKKTFKNDK